MRPGLPGGPYLVVGLARSGKAALEVLRARGEEVAGHDDRQRGDWRPLLERARTVVKSPGVPAEAPVIAAARRRGAEVIGELELAWRLLPQDWIAVTGTNGKTTTVELLGHVHRTAGVPVAVAGNVGTPLSSLVGAVERDTVIVAEASSFQLEDTAAFAPEVGVLLNIEPDHLDRHGTFAAYREAKLLLFARQGPEAVAVAPPDMEVPGRARRIGPHPLEGWSVGMRGGHNRVNAGFAAAAALARGLPEGAVREGLATFPGVPHRLEEVAERGGVLYVNDSKATNVPSTLVALAAFEQPVHLILGGQGKGQDFAPLAGPVRARCRGVYLIGEAAGELERVVGGECCGTLAAAVDRARAAAAPGDVVLLSPACASLDQFRDFEARGDAFRALVG